MDEINWTQLALEDLDNIVKDITKDTLEYTEITVSKLFAAIEIIESMPRAKSIVPEFQIESIKKIICGNYRIVCKIIHKFRIDILTVYNCEMLISNSKKFN